MNTESKAYQTFKRNFQAWKDDGMREPFDRYAIRANIKARDIARDAARNEKRQRMLTNDSDI